MHSALLQTTKSGLWQSQQGELKMSEAVVIQQEEMEENGFSVIEMAHKSVQVSLGAVDMAQAEVMALLEKAQKGVNELISEMAERGAKVEKNSRTRMNSFVDTRRKQVDSTINEATGSLDTRIENVLHTMNVPTKTDIEELNKKVSMLTRKINTLVKAQKAEKETATTSSKSN